VQGQIRVLHVEDNEADAALMARALRDAGCDVLWTRVETEEQFLRGLEPPPDVVVADYHLPSFSGPRALELLRARHPDIPLIVVSGTVGEEKAAEVMRLGADDYLLKDRLARLPAALNNAVREARGRARQRQAEAGLRRAQLMAKLAHVVTGVHGEFQSWSETLPALAGVGADTLPRTTRAWLQLVHPEDRDRFRNASIEGARTRQRTEVEYRLVRADATLAFVRQAMEPLEVGADEQGRMRWFNTLQDVTESKLAEERISRLNRVYAVLSGINAAIVRVRTEAEVLNEACRVAIDAGRFVMAWIGLVDAEASLVRPVAECGKDVREFLERAPLAVLETQPGGRGLAGRAVRDKAPVISNDVKNDPQRLMRVELEERDINSLAILPIMQDGEAIGVIALYASDVGFFDDEEMRLLTELAGDVSYALDQISKTRKLDYLSYYDQLTGLPNRTHFHERLKLQLEDAARKGEHVALQILDIERFKTINDTLGRQAGDALLGELAKRIQKGSLPTSWFARLDADHFAVVMPGLKGAEEVARRTEQRVAEIFGLPFRVGETELRISARIGIALFPDDATDADALLRNAEAALKKGKASGERSLFYTQEMTARVAERLGLESRLRQALENDEFVLHYQPKYEADGRTMAGMEALIRWQSPELGLVPPMHFIPLLEETGLILDVGAWALQRAARDHRAWAEQGLKPPRVAVNVSAVQLRRRDFVETLKRAIDDGAATGIDLEITESLVMEDIHASIEKLNALRRLGIGIAIDDFGTGYSSLFYLARLPVQTLKIDRSFIVGMVGDPAALTLVETMISLAHSLHLKVVAEGVETEEQADVLRQLGCDQMQGYLFSRPLTSTQMRSLLAGQPSRAARPPEGAPDRSGALPSQSTPQAQRRPRVLLADDERDTVLTLAELLRLEGYDARGVFAGADVAPAVLEFDPDVVLIDIAMPDRSGWEVAREIRAKHGPDRPTLIAISGMYKQAADQTLGKLGGFNYYLAKPCDPSVLLALLRNV
jgi:diguanylate cyclase (GGDEF)-like protein